MISCVLECCAMLSDAMLSHAIDANQEQPESPEEPRGAERSPEERSREEPRGAKRSPDAPGTPNAGIATFRNRYI